MKIIAGCLSVLPFRPLLVRITCSADGRLFVHPSSFSSSSETCDALAVIGEQRTFREQTDRQWSKSAIEGEAGELIRNVYYFVWNEFLTIKELSRISVRPRAVNLEEGGGQERHKDRRTIGADADAPSGWEKVSLLLLLQNFRTNYSYELSGDLLSGVCRWRGGRKLGKVHLKWLRISKVKSSAILSPEKGDIVVVSLATSRWDRKLIKEGNVMKWTFKSDKKWSGLKSSREQSRDLQFIVKGFGKRNLLGLGSVFLW